MRYFSRELVEQAFLRLREKEPSAKAGMEQTSALCYFLALERLCKNCGSEVILLDPVTGVGKRNRESMTGLYSELVVVRSSSGAEWFVENLGSVNTDERRTSTDRIGSDFLTTPLKKASRADAEQPYPRRGGRYLLRLGVEMFGKKWGVSRHPKWSTSVSELLEPRRSNTPWTDLALFVFRNDRFGAKGELWDIVEEKLTEGFSPEVSHLWVQQVMYEKRRFVMPDPWASEERVDHLVSFRPILYQAVSQSGLFEGSGVSAVVAERLHFLEEEVVTLRRRCELLEKNLRAKDET